MATETKSPLHKAAQFGDNSEIAMLLDRGADVNSVDDYGHTPLYLAVWNGHMETVSLLINRGANLDAKRIVTDMGNAWTPLHGAAENDQLECARLLLVAGADPNPEDQFGQTPLMMAIDEMSSPDVARLLIKYGASGRGALAWASLYTEGSNSDIFELLKKAEAI